MLWQIGYEDTEQDESDEIISGYVQFPEWRTEVHGEDEVEDVWGGEVGASSAGWSFNLVGAHGRYFGLTV